jgi:hypothetical protein
LFICHNVLEHETSFFKSMISRIALSHGDVYVTHSEWDKQNLLSWLGKSREPQVKVCVSLYQPLSIELVKKMRLARLGIEEEEFYSSVYPGVQRTRVLTSGIPLILREFHPSGHCRGSLVYPLY